MILNDCPVCRLAGQAYPHGDIEMCADCLTTRPRGEVHDCRPLHDPPTPPPTQLDRIEAILKRIEEALVRAGVTE